MGDRRFCWGVVRLGTLLLETVLRETVLRGEATASSSKNKKSERKWRATKKGRPNKASVRAKQKPHKS